MSSFLFGSIHSIDFVPGHYIPHAGGPQRSFKPDGVVHQSTAPFDDATMYRTEYTQKEIEPCPATFLEYVVVSYSHVFSIE